jgi:hypothetical protein
MIEALGDLPGQALVALLGLQVASREVVADGIAEHVRQRARDRNGAAALPDRDDELHFVVEVLRAGWIRNFAAIGDDGIGGLREEERRLAGRIAAHLADVFRVVAPDAVDPAHGVRVIAALDGQRRRSPRR